MKFDQPEILQILPEILQILHEMYQLMVISLKFENILHETDDYELSISFNYLALDSFIMCASLDLLASLHLLHKR